MKSKKKFVAISAMALCTALCFGAAGCGDKHTHDYEWEVTTPPTCTTEGVETGTCPKDNDTTTRPVAIDPNAHVYGEWVIEEPTFTEEGLAVKTCTGNAEHAKVEVTLPVLGSGEYTVTVTTQPTLTAEGEATYKLANAAGEISFTAPVAAKGYANVSEALDAALAAKALVGKTEQKNSNGTYTVLSEYGDKYLRVNDVDGSRELFFDFDEEGELVHAVEKNSWGDFSVIDINGEYFYNNPLDYAQGYRYYLSYALPAEEGFIAFGTENLLAMLYEFATDDTDTALVNGDYAEEMKVEDGKVVGSFSYGRFTRTERSRYNDTYSEVIGYNFTDFFYETVVTFTLDENSMLETLDIATNVYSFEYSTKPDKVTPFEDGATIDNPITADEDGVYSVDKSKFDESDIVLRAVSIKQTALSAIEELPENPIDFDEITVTSFELFNGTTKIENGATITTATKDALFLSVRNILPAGASEYIGLNVLGVYLKDGNTETAIDYSTAIMGSNNGQQIMLRSLHTVEEATIVVRIGEAELTFKLVVNESAPRSLSTSVNTYSEASDSYSFRLADEASIFLGQTLTFSAEGVRPAGESYDVSSAYTVSVNSENATVVDGTNGTKVFSATQAGTYVITLTSSVSASVTATITVTVQELPDFTEVLSGAYKNTVSEATVTFGAENTVTVVFADKTEVLGYELSEDNVLTTSHAGEADAGYALVLNDNYNLVLTYPDAGGVTQRILLVREDAANPAEALYGTSWESEKENMNWAKNKIAFNDDGATGVFTSGEGQYMAKVNFSYTLTNNGSSYSITFTQIGEAENGGANYFNCATASEGSSVTIVDGKVTAFTVVFTPMFGGGTMKMNRAGGSEPDPGPVVGENEFVLDVEKEIELEGYEWSQNYTLTVEESGTYVISIAFGPANGQTVYSVELVNPNNAFAPFAEGEISYSCPTMELELEAGTHLFSFRPNANSTAAVTITKVAETGAVYKGNDSDYGVAYTLTLRDDGTATLVEVQDGQYTYRYELTYTVDGDNYITFALVSLEASDSYYAFNTEYSNGKNTVVKDAQGNITSVTLYYDMMGNQSSQVLSKEGDDPVDDTVIVIGTEKEVEIESYSWTNLTLTVTESGTYEIAIAFGAANGQTTYTVEIFGSNPYDPLFSEEISYANSSVEVTLAAGTYTISFSAEVNSTAPVTITKA